MKTLLTIVIVLNLLATIFWAFQGEYLRATFQLMMAIFFQTLVLEINQKNK